MSMKELMVTGHENDSGMDALLEEVQYMIAHPGEFTEQQIEEAKDLFESLHD